MKNLTILQMNDLHGYLDLHNELYYDEKGIRLAKAGGLPESEPLPIPSERKKERSCFLTTETLFTEPMRRWNQKVLIWFRYSAICHLMP